MQYIVGVDFDNTFVSYEEVMYKTALKQGLITGEVGKNKKAIRDTIRALPDGELKWRRLQTFVYGKGIGGAVIFDGVKDFFKICKNAGVPVYIVSHKTKFSVLKEDTTDLREKALDWMRQNGVFDEEGFGLSRNRIFFESTPEEKIERIRRLGCTHFIDDLEEFFSNKIFPAHVEKILFAPSITYRRPSAPWRLLSTWQEINEYFTECINREFFVKESALVRKLLGESAFFSGKIGTGSNSRVFRVKSDSGKEYVAKFYFHHDTDTRDRLETEFSSLSFLRREGLQSIPQPVAVDRNAGCAVYEYIEGRKISPREITAGDIDYAVGFLGWLKRLAGKTETDMFLPASEAFFSIQKIVANIEARLKRLEGATKSGGESSAFLQEDLRPFWAILQEWCRATAEEGGIASDADIGKRERTLSPSDFGFHNALRTGDGDIVFLDFEYFGWDDPAKMISDFILHPAMALDDDLKNKFVEGISRVFRDNENLMRRVEVVYPLFAFKWCLIFLNEFIPDELKRRNFAYVNVDDKRHLQRVQLSKARKMLDLVKSTYRDFPCRIKYAVR